MVRPALLLAAAWAALCWAAVASANVVVHATVDRPSPHVNESFTYTLRAEGDVRGDPDVSALDKDFDVVQSTTSTRIQIVNGQAEQVSEWIYQLMPRRVGTVTIAPVEVAGAYSNAVDIDVEASTAADKAPSDIFMEVEADPTTAYVQAQVVYTMRLFIGVGTGRATVTPPKVSGGEAIVERLGDDREYQTTRGGRNFVVHERRYAVFPQKAGTLTLGPATFEAMVLPPQGYSRIQRFRSGTLDITVKPAVAPPPSYKDAAWLPARSVKLTEKWSDDPGKLEVGVPVTRTLTIVAEGLLETQLPPLDVPETQGVREYPDQPDLDRQAENDGITARRTERYAVLAQKQGQARLAAVELPWFDVKAGEWKLAEIQPRPLTVAPGDEAATPPPEPASAPAAPAASSAAAPRAVAGPAAPSRFWPVAAALLGLAWVGTAALWWQTRRVPRSPPSSSAAARAERPRASARRLLPALRAACARNDAEATRDLLVEWGALHFSQSPPRSLGALAGRAGPALAAAVRDLEASLYGPRGRQAWNGAELAAALEAAAAPERDARGRDVGDGLMPLYP